MGEKEKENEVPAGSIGTDGRDGPENAINKSDLIPPFLLTIQWMIFNHKIIVDIILKDDNLWLRPGRCVA